MNGVLGIQTHGCMMVDADNTTKLWWRPCAIVWGDHGIKILAKKLVLRGLCGTN